VLAIGAHAQAYHLARLGHSQPRGESLGALVARWRDFSASRPRVIPLPHPSWRNSGWLKQNPWFEADLLPELRREVARYLGR
jgi:uracil-DNA glycosylase